MVIIQHQLEKKLIVSVDDVKTKFGNVPYSIQVAVPLKDKEYAFYQYNTNIRIRFALTEFN